MTDAEPLRTVAALIEAGHDREAARLGARPTTRSAEPASFHDHGGPMDPLAQFDQLAPVLGTVVAGITPEMLDRPTPCREFTVRGVLEHMAGGATMFAAAYRGEPPSDPDLSDPLAAFGTAMGDLASAVGAPGALDRTVAAPWGDVPGDVFARFVVLDGLVHGWDMAVATGQPYDPPDALVAEVESFARGAVDPMRDSGAFDAEVEAPAGATRIERLAAYTGRAVARH